MRKDKDIQLLQKSCGDGKIAEQFNKAVYGDSKI